MVGDELAKRELRVCLKRGDLQTERREQVKWPVGEKEREQRRQVVGGKNAAVLESRTRSSVRRFELNRTTHQRSPAGEQQANGGWPVVNDAQSLVQPYGADEQRQEGRGCMSVDLITLPVQASFRRDSFGGSQPVLLPSHRAFVVVHTECVCVCVFAGLSKRKSLANLFDKWLENRRQTRSDRMRKMCA